MAFIRHFKFASYEARPAEEGEREAVRAEMWRFAKLRPWVLGETGDRWQEELAEIATRLCAAERVYKNECGALIRLTAQAMASSDRVAAIWEEVQATANAPREKTSLVFGERQG